jgi:FAD/FMN-containing dehydrogenase
VALRQEGAPPLDSAALSELRQQVEGDVILPGDAQYDEVRMAWNLTVQQHPALIVRAASADDVAAAARFATEVGLGIAVQATGHGVRRPADGCLLINTSRMKDVRVDAAAQTAWVEAGATWGDVLPPAQAVGLAPLLGSSPGVGAVGYTLGGGFGWLGRKYGLSVDSVHAFETVTADGDLLRASPTENSDLFWGLCGGGGSLAIVTAMEIALYPVATVYAGNLYYPAELGAEVLLRYRDWIADAPDELTSSIVIMNYPPIPEVPEFLRGKSLIEVRGCYCGPVEEGEALVQPWRDWQAPMIDDFKVRPFTESAQISNDPPDPMPSAMTGAWLAELDDATLDALLHHTLPQGGPPAITITEVRHAGGVISRVDRARNAYCHRDATLLLSVIGLAATPEMEQAFLAQVGRMKEAMGASLTGRVYINFLDGEESQQRIRDGYTPEAYRKLAALKAAYDPENRLSHSFNIPVATD